jgi:hypothetical protein
MKLLEVPWSPGPWLATFTPVTVARFPSAMGEHGGSANGGKPGEVLRPARRVVVVTIASRMRGLKKRSKGAHARSARSGSAPAATDRVLLKKTTTPVRRGSAATGAADGRDSYFFVAPASKVKGRPMGWYSVEGNLEDERFWNGHTWTARRRLINDAWFPAELESGELNEPPRQVQLTQRPRWGP